MSFFLDPEEPLHEDPPLWLTLLFLGLFGFVIYLLLSGIIFTGVE